MHHKAIKAEIRKQLKTRCRQPERYEPTGMPENDSSVQI